MTHSGNREAARATWHALPAAEVVASLASHAEDGLTSAEARVRLTRYGPNRLRAVCARPAWVLFLSQFRNLPALLLLVASVISMSLGRELEAAAVIAVIFLTAILGFVTEHRAHQAMVALQNLGAPRAKVRRDGELWEVQAEELVPGDVIEIDAGDVVPADARLVDTAGLLIEEAALTGESVGVEKDADCVAPADAPLADRRAMIYLGTTALEGRGEAVVVATGMATEAGRIGQLVEEVGEESTPLEKRLAQLGRHLIIAVLALAALYLAVGLWRGEDPGLMLLTGIVLAIAAVPEGLPAVATIALAIGMRRMARRNALVRRLPAVETLGSVTVICTDKTGTLTLNQMTLREILVADRRIEVTGEGYAPHGHFQEGQHLIDPLGAEPLMGVLRAGVLCNNAALQDEQVGDLVAWTIVGDPTEGALLVAASKAGLDPDVLADEYPRLAEVPFDSTCRYMVTIHRAPDGRRIAYAKGAPGAILGRCQWFLTADGIRPADRTDHERILSVNDQMGRQALRVLALASRELPDRWTEEDAETGLTFLGLVGIIDPPRPGVKETIRRCQQAGIRVVMLTGDQVATATALARNLGLNGHDGGTIAEQQLSRLDPGELAAAARRVAVFARVSPEHKLKIVQALRKAGDIVAMTGDGVNDAPALKRADIGVAMGRRGTDVAREAADMVLADDDLASIVAAVEEGRVIYANIRKFIQYLFACNLSEVFTMLIAVLVGLPFPLLPLQILWINLTVNVFPALALAGEPAEPGLMRDPPPPPRQSLLPVSAQLRIVGIGLLLAATALAAFIWALGAYGEGRHAETVAFVTLAMAQLWLAFTAGSQRSAIHSLRRKSNPALLGAVVLTSMSLLAAVYLPGLETVLESAALTLRDWTVVLVFSLVPAIVIEVMKWVRRQRNV
jgi:P-type Ca2+ transporter type 2C